MIEIKNVSKTYKTKKGVKTLALDNVSFKLPEKGLFFILGKSGSGKSTLLNILGGLDSYDSGDMIVDSKSTKKFRGKDFDYYRTTYIGFIFQEFNLLEEYNVYDNIILSRKLQKEKVSQEKIDNLLNKVGISGLGKRRINELSGGQKGRVAIARALIKNPEIILADEPTGNLDEETGRQIFSLLKSISKEKLVIVVSHDRDSASYYADGIIEIADGHIISNTIPEFVAENKKFKSKKSKLPFLSSLKFAFANLSSHKVKLFFTILLVFMSIVFFGASKILSKFNIEKSHAETMNKNHNEYITLRKGVYKPLDRIWVNGSSYIDFTEDEIKKLDEQIKSPYALMYLLNEENEFVNFDIDFKGIVNEETPSYYFSSFYNYKFIETDKSFVNQKMIGEYPTEYDEIMIHSYLADYIMKYGIALYDENPNQFKKEYYKPTNYEDFLGDKYYKFGSTKVKISGIILDNVEPYEHLKNIPYNNLLNDNHWLGIPKNTEKRFEFGSLITNVANQIYVAKVFSKNINLKENTVIDRNYYMTKLKKGNDYAYFISDTVRYLNQKISVFNGEKMIEVESLKDNEIIVSEDYLDKISKNEYSKLKEQYIKNYNEEMKKIELENKKIREENKKLEEEYEKKLETEEDIEEPLYKEEKEIIYKDESELKQEFLINYMKENHPLDENITLLFLQQELEEGKNVENLKIIGIELDGNYIYISNTIAPYLMRENAMVSNIIVKENNEKELERLFKLFPRENAEYTGETTYTYTINIIASSLESIAILARYASYIFGFFAFILLTNFIVTSIYYNKKTIGILRGLGARKKDVFKIFLNEGMIIGTFSLILSIIALYTGIYIVNDYISSHLFYHISFITFTKENLCIVIGSVYAIIFISSLFTVRKIAKMNPVDAILNK